MQIIGRVDECVVVSTAAKQLYLPIDSLLAELNVLGVPVNLKAGLEESIILISRHHSAHAR